jgi:hypothetical protein
MRRQNMDKSPNQQETTPLVLEIEVLEERIAPSVLGTGGYEGQPGNQSNSGGGGNSGYEGQPGNQSNG